MISVTKYLDASTNKLDSFEVEFKPLGPYQQIYDDLFKAGVPNWRGVVMGSGRSSGKTRFALDMCIIATFAEVDATVMILRQTLTSIRTSSHAQIKRMLKEYGLQSLFHVTRNTFTNLMTKTRIEFGSIDPKQSVGIKSVDNAVFAFIEEAQELEKESFRSFLNSLRGSFRGGEAPVIIAGNPLRSDSFFYKDLLTGEYAARKNWMVTRYNYNEPGIIEVVPQSILTEAAIMQEENPEQYEHEFLGQPVSANDMLFMQHHDLLRCIDSHKVMEGGDEMLLGEPVIGFDVGGKTGDPHAIAVSKGCVIAGVKVWREHAEKAAMQVYGIAHKNSFKHVIYDAIGVGEAVASTYRLEIKEAMKKTPHKVNFAGYNAGAEVPRKKRRVSQGVTIGDLYDNSKAYYWSKMADRVRKTVANVKAAIKGEPQIYSVKDCISFSTNGISKSNLELLLTELSTPEKEYRRGGRIGVETKQKLKARGINSHNAADAVIMTEVEDLKRAA